MEEPQNHSLYTSNVSKSVAALISRLCYGSSILQYTAICKVLLLRWEDSIHTEEEGSYDFGDDAVMEGRELLNLGTLRRMGGKLCAIYMNSLPRAHSLTPST